MGKRLKKERAMPFPFCFSILINFSAEKNQHRFGKRFAIGPYKETSPAIFSEKMLREEES